MYQNISYYAERSNTYLFLNLTGIVITTITNLRLSSRLEGHPTRILILIFGISKFDPQQVFCSAQHTITFCAIFSIIILHYYIHRLLKARKLNPRARSSPYVYVGRPHKESCSSYHVVLELCVRCSVLFIFSATTSNSRLVKAGMKYSLRLALEVIKPAHYLSGGK